MGDLDFGIMLIVIIFAYYLIVNKGDKSSRRKKDKPSPKHKRENPFTKWVNKWLGKLFDKVIQLSVKGINRLIMQSLLDVGLVTDIFKFLLDTDISSALDVGVAVDRDSEEWDILSQLSKPTDLLATLIEFDSSESLEVNLIEMQNKTEALAKLLGVPHIRIELTSVFGNFILLRILESTINIDPTLDTESILAMFNTDNNVGEAKSRSNTKNPRYPN